MTNFQLIESIINKNDGVAKTSDFIAAGINKYEISKLLSDNKIERITNGYYKLENEFLDFGQVLKAYLPEGILFLETALYYYFYSDYTPRKFSIAVPRNISKNRLKKIPMPAKYFYISENIFELGLTTMEIDGRELRIYDRERTICDCFKYKNKIDIETFIKAIKAYAYDENNNITRLISYSKQLGVYNQVIETMRILLND